MNHMFAYCMVDCSISEEQRCRMLDHRTGGDVPCAQPVDQDYKLVRVKLLNLFNLDLNIEPFKSSRDDMNINTIICKCFHHVINNVITITF